MQHQIPEQHPVQFPHGTKIKQRVIQFIFFLILAMFCLSIYLVYLNSQRFPVNFPRMLEQFSFQYPEACDGKTDITFELPSIAQQVRQASKMNRQYLSHFESEAIHLIKLYKELQDFEQKDSYDAYQLGLYQTNLTSCDNKTSQLKSNIKVSQTVKQNFINELDKREADFNTTQQNNEQNKTNRTQEVQMERFRLNQVRERLQALQDIKKNGTNLEDLQEKQKLQKHLNTHIQKNEQAIYSLQSQIQSLHKEISSKEDELQVLDAVLSDFFLLENAMSSSLQATQEETIYDYITQLIKAFQERSDNIEKIIKLESEPMRVKQLLQIKENLSKSIKLYSDALASAAAKFESKCMEKSCIFFTLPFKQIKLVDLRDVISQKEDNRRTLQNEVASRKQTLGDMRTQLQKKELERTTLQGKLEDINKKIQDIEDFKNNYQSMEALDSKIKEAEADLAKVELVVKGFDQAIGEINHRIDKLKVQFEAQKNETLAEIELYEHYTNGNKTELRRELEQCIRIKKYHEQQISQFRQDEARKQKKKLQIQQQISKTLEAIIKFERISKELDAGAQEGEEIESSQKTDI